MSHVVRLIQTEYGPELPKRRTPFRGRSASFDDRLYRGYSDSDTQGFNIRDRDTNQNASVDDNGFHTCVSSSVSCVAVVDEDGLELPRSDTLSWADDAAVEFGELGCSGFENINQGSTRVAMSHEEVPEDGRAIPIEDIASLMNMEVFGGKKQDACLSEGFINVEGVVDDGVPYDDAVVTFHEPLQTTKVDKDGLDASDCNVDLSVHSERSCEDDFEELSTMTTDSGSECSYETDSDRSFQEIGSARIRICNLIKATISQFGYKSGRMIFGKCNNGLCKALDNPLDTVAIGVVVGVCTSGGRGTVLRQVLGAIGLSRIVKMISIWACIRTSTLTMRLMMKSVRILDNTRVLLKSVSSQAVLFPIVDVNGNVVYEALPRFEYNV